VKLIQVPLFCALIALGAAGAHADTIAYFQVTQGVSTLVVLDPASYYSGAGKDPQLLVRRLKRGSIPFTGFEFGFAAETGTGFFDYYNDNDASLAELTLSITPGGPASESASIFGCGVESEFPWMPFSACSFGEFGTDVSATVVNFFGGSGLPPYSHFAIELTDFPANATIVATAVPQPTPEPESLALILTGALGLGAARWLRRRQGSAS
jgi:hypothetical protein